MRDTESRIPAEWEEVGNDLGLEIWAPYELTLPSGYLVRAPVLVRHFGGPKGMLVVSDDSILDWGDAIIQMGYGFSVLGEPSQKYDRKVYIEMLSEWGWWGPDSEEPVWLQPATPVAE